MSLMLVLYGKVINYLPYSISKISTHNVTVMVTSIDNETENGVYVMTLANMLPALRGNP